MEIEPSVCFFLIFIFHILLCMNILLASAQCLENQKSLLLEFKESLIFNSSISTKLIKWNRNKDCCKWRGVTCNNKTGNVIGLDLDGESISAAINSSGALFHLRFLETLDLANNDFKSTEIPSGLFNLTSLTYLSLENSNFGGEIPYGISSLTRLSELQLSRCHFSGKIPNSMVKLTQLVYLYLSYNNLSGSIPSLENYKNLSRLELSYNKLSGPIPSTHFEGLDNLLHVGLSHNEFNGIIPSSLFALPSLFEIDLSHNHFEGLLDKFLIDSSSQLSSLDLSGNNLNGSIPMSLFRHESLNILKMSSNKFTGKIELDTVNYLTDLDLSNNHIESFKTSRDDLFPVLETISLSSCKLQEFPNLSNLSEVIFFDLSDNQISGEIPNWIWKLGNGYFSYLNLSQNQLMDIEKPYAMPNFDYLDLHSNQLIGELPVPPGDAIYVDYSANNFNSSIPLDIGNNLTYANFFSVSRNKLTGSIPASICKATYLQVLDFSNNDFSGTIPPCLFGLNETLQVLDLGNNNLTGSISDTFNEKCGLKSLNLHSNRIEGTVPKSLANCTTLQVLNLGNNRINDTFPCFLSSSSNLRVLVLRFNDFQGDISCPGLTSHWPNLQIMDIASNHFSGEVPQNWFFNWTGMINDKGDAQLNVNYLSSSEYYQDTVTLIVKGLEVELVKILTIFNSIDMSNNMFEGNIPDLFGNLKLLRLLNLSQNAFTGLIPLTFGNLKQLEALDLSVNKLTGIIPTELTRLTFLSFLNLSYNQLTGKVPVGSQFSTFEEKSFKGNKGLCGVPLMITCTEAEGDPSSGRDDDQHSRDDIKWDMISAEIGFSVGLGIVLMPLLFYRRWRISYYERVDETISWIFRVEARKRRNRERRRGNIPQRGRR